MDIVVISNNILYVYILDLYTKFKLYKSNINGDKVYRLPNRKFLIYSNNKCHKLSIISINNIKTFKSIKLLDILRSEDIYILAEHPYHNGDFILYNKNLVYLVNINDKITYKYNLGLYNIGNKYILPPLLNYNKDNILITNDNIVAWDGKYKITNKDNKLIFYDKSGKYKSIDYSEINKVKYGKFDVKYIEDELFITYGRNILVSDKHYIITHNFIVTPSTADKIGFIYFDSNGYLYHMNRSDDKINLIDNIRFSRYSSLAFNHDVYTQYIEYIINNINILYNIKNIIKSYII